MQKKESTTKKKDHTTYVRKGEEEKKKGKSSGSFRGLPKPQTRDRTKGARTTLRCEGQGFVTLSYD